MSINSLWGALEYCYVVTGRSARGDSQRERAFYGMFAVAVWFALFSMMLIAVFSNWILNVLPIIESFLTYQSDNFRDIRNRSFILILAALIIGWGVATLIDKRCRHLLGGAGVGILRSRLISGGVYIGLIFVMLLGRDKYGSLLALVIHIWLLWYMVRRAQEDKNWKTPKE
ncbi:hypothetical protein [Pseudoxanthomonas broegbernensis]|uniref:hypothetical protein n=1 Tax=Pseudoxanthomonas broegbernensis TaxID=83619 RepID=UPI001391835C|nr:hypothetical protein [Pseudoxanthomonas broegbernensis]MBB6066476.1 putative membrane protein [Pseudoxanthomonas broegbernensis]